MKGMARDGWVRNWNPSQWLLAQDCHIAYGLAIVFGLKAFSISLWWTPVALAIELVLKEGVFDQLVEGNPLIWDGLIDWAFYLIGASIALVMLALL